MHFVFTGVPHLVVIGNEMSLESAKTLGKLLRKINLFAHESIIPKASTSILSGEHLKESVRTYEVGVRHYAQLRNRSAASAHVAAKFMIYPFPLRRNHSAAT